MRVLCRFYETCRLRWNFWHVTEAYDEEPFEIRNSLAVWRDACRTAFPGRQKTRDGLERPSYFTWLKCY